MIFSRLVWSSLAVALLVGGIQTGVQSLQAQPLLLAAEVFEEQKGATPTLAFAATAAGLPAPAVKPHAESHEHAADKEWAPGSAAERTAWRFVANALHAFSMALLVFALMGVWRYRHGAALGTLPLAGLVASAGWLSFYLWPTLGLPAQVPGMEAAPLQARQLWTVLAVSCALAACAVAGFGGFKWRWSVSAALLALPFVVGAPKLSGDAWVGYSPSAQAELAQLLEQFFWATSWVALSFWLAMALACALAFSRCLQPVLAATLSSTHSATGR